MSFVGGKLKLKGGDALKSDGGVKKKKKKKTSDSDTLAVASEQDAQHTSVKSLLEGVPLPPRDEGEDRRTEAEKRHEEHLRRFEAQQIKKLAAKSHRERVKDFNEHLAQLTEHYDIPKVGPG